MKINKHTMPAAIPYLLMSTLWVSCFTFSSSGGVFIDINKLNLSLIVIGGVSILMSFFLFFKLQPFAGKFALNKVDFAISLWFIFTTLVCWITKRHFEQEQYLLFVIGVVCYCCCRLVVYNNRKTALYAFLLCIGLLTSIESILAILQFIRFIPSLNEFFVITGTFKNPAPMAMLLSSCLPFIYYSFCMVRRTWLKTFFAFDLILSLFAICISGNRTSYFALIVIICVYCVSQFNLVFPTFTRLQSRLSKIIASAMTVVLLFALIYYLYSLKPVSADGRLLIWTVSYHQIFEHPMLGGGIGSFKENYSIWQAMYFDANLDSRLFSDISVSNIAGYVRLAYNEYLEILIEQGLIGLILFLSIFYYSFQFAIPRLIKQHRSILIPVIASLLTILMQSFVSYPLHSGSTIILMFLLLAFLNHETQIAPIKQDLVINQQKPTAIISILLLAGLLILFTGVRRVKNYDAYISARKLFKHNHADSRIIFDSLSDKLSADPGFLIDYSICLASQKEYEKAVINLIKASKLDGDPQIYMLLGDLYTKLKKYDLAEESYKLACLIVPSLIYPRYSLVKLLIIRGKTDDAKIIAKAILNSKVKLPDERVDKMIYEMRLFLDSNH